MYAAPQLFAAYREQLGRPISRDGARAIADALAARYVQDGFVKPEIALDDSSGRRAASCACRFTRRRSPT